MELFGGANTLSTVYSQKGSLTNVSWRCKKEFPMSSTRAKIVTAVAAILTIAFTVSLTACQVAPSKSVSAKQTSVPNPTPSMSTTLNPCPVMANWLIMPVSADVLAAVTYYYSAKHLTPITISKSQELNLDVKEQSAGWHYCQNVGGGTGGYAGAVPPKATAAVMVYVQHKPYPSMPITSNFVTLALIPGTGWRVVAEGTGP